MEPNPNFSTYSRILTQNNTTKNPTSTCLLTNPQIQLQIRIQQNTPIKVPIGNFQNHN
jgi:hypothetical protein